MEFITLLEQEKVVPVVAVEEPELATGLAEALLAGGIHLIEVTFRTEKAAEVIATIHKNVPQMHLCAGTVLTTEQAQQASDAGAEAIVSPGTNQTVVQFCQSKGLPITPGCATPTEVETALALGLRTVKFFPAEAMGGTAMLKALAGPYGGVRFMPTGGIDCHNIADYLALPNVIACGSSWIAPKNLVAEGNFAEITQRARTITALAREVSA